MIEKLTKTNTRGIVGNRNKKFIANNLSLENNNNDSFVALLILLVL